MVRPRKLRVRWSPGYLGVLFTLLAAGSRAEPLEVTDAISQALQHNRELARTALGIDREQWGVRNAEADFSIRVRPDSNVGFSSEQDDWQYGLALGKKLAYGTSVDIGSRVSNTQPEGLDNLRRTSVGVEVSQPLFRNFGRLISKEPLTQAHQRLKSARRAYQQQQADLVVQVVERFENIIQLRARLEADEQFLGRTEKLYRLTLARERQGRVTRVDTLRVELQRGQALARMEDARQQLVFEEQNFAELLGADPGTQYELVAPPLLDFEPPGIEEAVSIALENRLDYAQTLQDYRDQGRNVAIARRGLYPDVSLVTRYEQFGEGPRNRDAYALDDNAWFVGVVAGADFNPVRERAALEEARVDQTASGQTVEITELVIARQVQQELAAYRRARAEYGIADRNLPLARNRARLARRLFELGRGDNFSVTDAEDALLQARNEMLRARAEASLASYRLLRTLGTLVEVPEDLAPREVAGR